MAHELNIPLDPATQSGLSVSAQLWLAGTLVATVSLAESGAGTAFYSNTSTLPTLAAGVYAVRFIVGGAAVGDGEFNWNGAVEVMPPSTGPGTAPGDLISLARANQNTTLASLPADYLASLISAASTAIQRACMRRFGPGTYTEYHDGLGYPGQYLQLDQCPVTAITRLATRPVPAISLIYTGTAPRATVATTATGITLVPGGTVLYSAATTLAALSTAVTTITGWSATVDPQFTAYASADLRPLQGAVTAFNRSAALEAYAECDGGLGYNDSYANLPQSGWRLDAQSGQLWGHFPEGRSNIRIDYTAGDDTVPADIQQACVRLASLMAEDERRDSRVDRQQMGPYQVYFTARVGSFIRDPGVWDLIGPHRDLSQLI